jgi:hypothetical protein
MSLLKKMGPYIRGLEKTQKFNFLAFLFRYKFGLRVLVLEGLTHFIAYEASGRLVDKDEST